MQKNLWVGNGILLVMVLLYGVAATAQGAGATQAAQKPGMNPLPNSLSDPLSAVQDGASAPNLLTTPTLTPGEAFLFGLEKKFAAAVAEGGGAAFASFFDKDGVTLGNRATAAIGQTAIAAQARWSPQDYQLTWTPEGGQLAPAGDMGYTWGHYEGRTKNLPPTHGRYMTVWKKEPDGTWKVVLETSNEDAPAACTCSVDEKQK
jgi:ketosteroid isomerase-like protein